MRMRKKKHLEDRLAECKNLFVLGMTGCDTRTANDCKTYLDVKEIFGNGNPVHMEIGCGKGRFACEIARRNPDINYIAVEKTANVLVSACEQGRDISNLYFLHGGAEYLPKFIKPHTVERIYLNFSCPFPKNRQQMHRLTNPRFLKIYKELMADGAEIHQKTDNMHFFEYSLEQWAGEGFALKNISLDLHASEFEGNIMTEYEERFSSLGQPIYRLEAFLK